MELSIFIQQLQLLIEEKNLLKHPFYRHWEDGTLPIAVMQKYAEQYYHLEKNFPRFLSRLHTDCEDPNIRQTITENLYDEEHGPDNHRELWLRFAESVGANRQAVQSSTPLPQTTDTIATFSALSAESLPAGVAALAAYESQIPAVAKSKLAGLKKHYGISDENGTAFFRVHNTLDVEHSRAWWVIIEQTAITPTLREEVKKAVVAGRDALWNFLDGVCAAYFPEAIECSPTHAT